MEEIRKQEEGGSELSLEEFERRFEEALRRNREEERKDREEWRLRLERDKTIPLLERSDEDLGGYYQRAKQVLSGLVSQLSDRGPEAIIPGDLVKEKPHYETFANAVVATARGVVAMGTTMTEHPKESEYLIVDDEEARVTLLRTADPQEPTALTLTIFDYTAPAPDGSIEVASQSCSLIYTYNLEARELSCSRGPDAAGRQGGRVQPEYAIEALNAFVHHEAAGDVGGEKTVL